MPNEENGKPAKNKKGNPRKKSKNQGWEHNVNLNQPPTK